MSLARLELLLLTVAALPAAALAAPFFASSLGVEAEKRTQKAAVRIKASPHVVHALVDPAATFNRWRLRGERVEPLDARAGRWRYFCPAMPERPFELEVLRSEPAALVETRCVAEDRRPFGAVLASAGVYEITPTNDGARVTLTETTTFLAGLVPANLAMHVLLMRISMRMDLLRLKHEAETGRDAAPDRSRGARAPGEKAASGFSPDRRDHEGI